MAPTPPQGWPDSPIDPAYPRPDLIRDDWLDLTGEWQFEDDDDDQGERLGWSSGEIPFSRVIRVPYPPESVASGIGDTRFHPLVWYRRTAEIHPPRAGERVLLHCGAVDYAATVWVNGHLVGVHEGGHTPFTCDLTEVLRTDGTQRIVIRAEDQPDDLEKPRGKQDWREQPHDIWYDRTTGIWQPIWVETVPATSIERLLWEPRLADVAFDLLLDVRGRVTLDLTARIRLALGSDEVVDLSIPLHASRTRVSIDLTPLAASLGLGQLCWTPEHPVLFDAWVRLEQDEKTIDAVRGYAGLRSVAYQSDAFTLNGERYPLRLILEQGFWSESHLAAPSGDALRREVEWIKRLGFNGVRIHQKIEDPRFLAWCDRLGVLVWEEMPSAYVFSERAMSRLVREWTAVIERDRGHPCIMAWVPFNESWGVSAVGREPRQRAYVAAVYHLTRALDETRLVIDNDGWEHSIGDILTIHDYHQSGAALRELFGSKERVHSTIAASGRDRPPIVVQGAKIPRGPIILSEFGGVSQAPPDGDAWFGYGSVSDIAAFARLFGELVAAVRSCESLAGFCYTQLTDTGQETNGLLTARREPKLDPALVRALVTGDAAPEVDATIEPPAA